MAEPLYDGPLARLVRRMGAVRQPDPWPAEFDAAVRDPAAVPLCLNCLCPQKRHVWFCPVCGFPTGDYVATMPYLTAFLDGECFRKGVMGPPERRTGVLVFPVVYSTASYGIFAPLYWFWMVRRAQGKPICHERRWDFEIDGAGLDCEPQWNVPPKP